MRLMGMEELGVIGELPNATRPHPMPPEKGKPCQENFPVTRLDTLPDTHNPVAHSRLTGKVTECQEILKKLFCRKLFLFVGGAIECRKTCESMEIFHWFIRIE